MLSTATFLLIEVFSLRFKYFYPLNSMSIMLNFLQPLFIKSLHMSFFNKCANQVREIFQTIVALIGFPSRIHIITLIAIFAFIFIGILLLSLLFVIFFVLSNFLFNLKNLLFGVGEDIWTVNSQHRDPIIFHIIYLLLFHILSCFSHEILNFIIQFFMFNASLCVRHISSRGVKHSMEDEIVIKVNTLQVE